MVCVCARACVYVCLSVCLYYVLFVFCNILETHTQVERMVVEGIVDALYPTTQGIHPTRTYLIPHTQHM